MEELRRQPAIHGTTVPSRACYAPILFIKLPWHRVVGAGGEIRLRGAAAHEQRARLKLEGVRFNRKRVDMEHFEHSIKPWEIYK